MKAFSMITLLVLTNLISYAQSDFKSKENKIDSIMTANLCIRESTLFIAFCFMPGTGKRDLKCIKAGELSGGMKILSMQITGITLPV